MAEQNGESIKTSLASSASGEKGIEQTNAALAREEETQLQGATRQGVINKLEAKLRQDHPDWPDDRVKTIAMRMFEQATSKPTGASSNEANADERGPENEMKAGAKATAEYSDTGLTGS